MAVPTIVCVVGPTAAGKTSLAIQLAQRCNGEVISADSRQVYRGLDIGTGKVTTEEMCGIPHHLLDVVDVDQVYTGADFVRDADAAIADIHTRGRVPIVAGGTYFYVQLLRREMAAAPVSPNPTLRKELETYQTEELYAQLQQVDPQRAEHIDQHNRRRLIRALEIVDAMGSTPPATPEAKRYREIMIGIDRDKASLREKFARRAHEWLAAGIETEVEHLLTSGVSRGRLREIGFEYELVLDLLSETLTRDTYIQRFVEKNWQYAKKQRTWMYKDPQITWYTPETAATALEAVHHALTQEQ